MNYINPYLEPGTYVHADGGIVVVKDVANYVFNTEKMLMEYGPALVIFRPLIEKIDEHNVRAMPLSEFTKQYTKQ